MRTKEVAAEIVRYRMLRRQSQVEVTVWFRCPNCGKKHRVRELFTPPHNFTEPIYARRCGHVRVMMPWAFAAAKVQAKKKFEYTGVLICNGKPLLAEQSDPTSITGLSVEAQQRLLKAAIKQESQESL